MLRILHLLSQRPDSTGSGVYLQAILHEAAVSHHTNFLVAGIQSDRAADLEVIARDRCRFLAFGDADVSYPIVGMSDAMPYESTRFRDLTPGDLEEYESAFSRIIHDAVDAFKPDMIHSHHLWIMSSVARRLFPDLPMVTTCHGSDLRQFQKCPHLQPRVLSGCRKLDAIMALSGAQKDEIVRLYAVPREKVFVVGAGFNHALFTRGPKPVPDPVQMVYAGKLSKSKGVPWLLRALTRIESPPWRLHLVGSGAGEERDECLRLATDLGGRVIAHGATSQETLAGIMRQSHVFILPSFYEGVALVLLEALASGCRIVATSLPGVSEVLGSATPEFVTLVETPRLRSVDEPYAEDEASFEQDLADALREQMRGALRQPEIDLSSIQDRIDSFSWTTTFKRIQEVYSGVMTG